MIGKPLILDYKVPYTDSFYDLKFHYDHKTSMNMILQNGNMTPFIDLPITSSEITTRTRIRQEQDDQQFLFELSTRTKVVSEQDDLHNSLLELSTKTLVKQETDDERNFNHFQ